MKKIKCFLYLLFPLMAIAQNKVGIGTSIPQQRLSIDSSLNVDQGNYDDGTKPSLRFGSNAGEAIGSKRNDGGVNPYGLDFYTNFNKRMVITQSGNIGIGQNSPGFPLNFASTLGDKISFYGNSGNNYGIGIAINALQLHTDASTADILFGYGSSNSFNETMRIKGNGNVGIGTSNPGAGLQINHIGNFSWSEGFDNPFEISCSNETLYMGADYLHSMSYIQAVGSGTFHTLSLQARGGNVAIGKAVASEKLDVDGNIKASGNSTLDGTLLVHSDKGIVRNVSNTQLKTTVVNYDLGGFGIVGGETASAIITFENFNAPPAVMLGGITGGAGAPSQNYKQYVYNITSISNNSCLLTIYNNTGYGFTFPGGTSIKIIAIGPE